MAWYVYKCNSRNEPHQNHYGEWRDFFNYAGAGDPISWGTTSRVPALSQLEKGDKILAFQSNRNSLMGLVEVDGWRVEDGCRYVYLRPLLRLGPDGVKVRPLKKVDERIDGMEPLKAGPVKTLYEIDASDAEYLLDKAKTRCVPIDFADLRRAIMVSKLPRKPARK